MRLRVALLVAVAACGDSYGLDVTVDNAAGVTIARTELSVYEGAVTCTAIEFGDISPAELEPALVDRQVLVAGDDTAVPLSNLSRVDRKVIVARALSPDGSAVAMGCTEVGEVTGEQRVTVTTNVAATASVSFLDRTVDPTAISVIAADPNGTPLEGRAVSWRVWGPAGSEPVRTTGVTVEADSAWTASAPSCTAGGVATLHPVPPSVVGGYAIEPRVSWAAEPIPMLGTINVDPMPAQLGTIPDVRHPCAIGRGAAGPRLVCMTSVTDVAAFTYSSTGVIGAPMTTALGFTAIGVYASSVGSETHVFAMGAGGELARVFPTFANLTCTTCGALAIDDVVALPACGASGVARAVVHTAGAGNAELRWVDATGGTMTALPFMTVAGTSVSLGAAGCATILTPGSSSVTTVPAIALDYAVAGVTTRTRLALDCAAGTCTMASLPLPGVGIGFSVDAQPSVLAASVDATGIVLLRALIVRTASEASLVEIARQPAAAPPARIVSAQLDGDGRSDMLWDETIGRFPVLQVAYAREVRGVPLSALTLLTRTTTELSIRDLLAGDVTSDGHDDVVLVTRSALGKLGVAVLPSQIAATGTTVPADVPCP